MTSKVNIKHSRFWDEEMQEAFKQSRNDPDDAWLLTSVDPENGSYTSFILDDKELIVNFFTLANVFEIDSFKAGILTTLKVNARPEPPSISVDDKVSNLGVF